MIRVNKVNVDANANEMSILLTDDTKDHNLLPVRLQIFSNVDLCITTE